MPSLNLPPKLSFEFRFRMFIRKVYFTKSKRLKSSDFLSTLKHEKCTIFSKYFKPVSLVRRGDIFLTNLPFLQAYESAKIPISPILITLKIVRLSFMTDQ